jgi:hypothetical protein
MALDGACNRELIMSEDCVTLIGQLPPKLVLAFHSMPVQDRIQNEDT